MNNENKKSHNIDLEIFLFKIHFFTAVRIFNAF